MKGGEVYISGIYQNYLIGNKLGLRMKWRGREYDPPSFVIPLPTEEGSDAFNRSAKGYRVERDQFPEALAVWNEKDFAKSRDVLFAGPFLTVTEKIADVLSRFDLGDGELVPVPLFQADLVTPWSDSYYYINYSEPKDTVVLNESKNIQLMYEKNGTGERLFRVLFAASDDDIALSRGALQGTDIWIEKCIFSKLFISRALAEALHEAGIDVDLELHSCRIVKA